MIPTIILAPFKLNIPLSDPTLSQISIVLNTPDVISSGIPSCPQCVSYNLIVSSDAISLIEGKNVLSSPQILQ